MAIRMDQQGVEALKSLATALPDAAQATLDAATNLESSFEDKKDLLGPHTSQIEQIIESTQKASATGHSAIIKVQTNLVKAAAALAAIIGGSFGGSSGNPT